MSANELGTKHVVRVHIDQKPYESPNPTAGEALYRLGQVAAGLELFREVTGNREDRFVINGPELIHLKQDEHFHSEAPAEFKIVVNGQQKTVTGSTISFEQVVKLAFATPPYGENTLFSVTFRKGHGHKPEGILDPGQSVRVKEGMIFDVTPTDKS